MSRSSWRPAFVSAVEASYEEGLPRTTRDYSGPAYESQDEYMLKSRHKWTPQAVWVDDTPRSTCSEVPCSEPQQPSDFGQCSPCAKFLREMSMRQREEPDYIYEMFRQDVDHPKSALLQKDGSDSDAPSNYSAASLYGGLHNDPIASHKPVSAYDTSTHQDYYQHFLDPSSGRSSELAHSNATTCFVNGVAVTSTIGYYICPVTESKCTGCHKEFSKCQNNGLCETLWLYTKTGCGLNGAERENGHPCRFLQQHIDNSVSMTMTAPYRPPQVHYGHF